MKLCIKVHFYIQFESTLPILDKSFYLKNNWRVRDCFMYEIFPLSPIASTRVCACYGTFASASTLSHPLQDFCVRWFSAQTSVQIRWYKKHKNRACVLIFDFYGSKYSQISKKFTSPSLRLGANFTSCNNGPLKALFFDTSAIKMTLARQSHSGKIHFYHVY